MGAVQGRLIIIFYKQIVSCTFDISHWNSSIVLNHSIYIYKYNTFKWVSRSNHAWFYSNSIFVGVYEHRWLISWYLHHIFIVSYLRQFSNCWRGFDLSWDWRSSGGNKELTAISHAKIKSIEFSKFVCDGGLVHATWNQILWIVSVVPTTLWSSVFRRNRQRLVLADFSRVSVSEVGLSRSSEQCMLWNISILMTVWELSLRMRTLGTKLEIWSHFYLDVQSWVADQSVFCVCCIWCWICLNSILGRETVSVAGWFVQSN